MEAAEASDAPESLTRRDAIALATTLLPLAALYALTLCPTVWWYDSAEFAARATQVHSAHAPGYPSYILIAHLFTYLGPEPAWGTNLMSAVFALGSVAGAYVLQRLMGVREVFAAVASFALGASPVLWANAVITEVYGPGLCFTLATFCLLVAGQAPGRERLIPIAAGVAGFGVGMHLSLLTCGLAFVVLAAASGMPTRTWPELARVFGPAQWRRRLRFAGWCALGLAVGLSVYWIFPLITFENPLSRGAWRGWYHLITAKVFRVKFVEATAKTDFPARNLAALRAHLGWPGLVLGCAGLVAALVRRPLLGLCLGLGVLGNVWMFWNYEVHDVEVFFLPAAAIGFVLAGYASESGVALLEARLESTRARLGLTLALAGALSLWPLASLRSTYAEVDHSESTEARAYGEMLVRELPPDAMFVKYNHPCEWKHFAVFLYMQALGERGDVRVRTRPNLDELDEQLAEGAEVFAFCNVRRVRRRVDLKQDERGLIRVVRTTHELPRK